MNPTLTTLVSDLLARSLGQETLPPKLLDVVSERTQQYLERSAAARENAQVNTINRIGAHRLQAELLRKQGRLSEALSAAAAGAVAKPIDWELVAWVFFLGEVVVSTAIQLLSPELKELAERWQMAADNAEEQIKVCQALQEALSSRKEREELEADAKSREQLLTELESAWTADYFDQPLARIIPVEFLKEGGRPNCLGKGILLTAFFQSVGVEVYGATPIHPFHDAAEGILSQLAGVIDHLSVEAKVGKPEKLAAAFERRERLAKIRENTPERFHMGVIVPLCDGRHYFIDPHMCCSGLFGEEEALEGSLELMNFASSILPGFVFFHSEMPETDRVLRAASMAAGVPIDAANSTLRRWDTINRHPLGAIPLLAHSRVLELLLEEGFYKSEEEAKHFLGVLRGEVDSKYIILRLGEEGMEGVLTWQTASGRELTPEEITRCNIAALVLNFASRGEMFHAYLEQHKGGNRERVISQEVAELRESEALHKVMSEAMHTCLGIMFSMAYRLATKAMHYGKDDDGMPHPILEIYEPWFRIGVEIASHANAIGNADESVVMDLAALCTGQFHATLAAAEPLRTGSRSKLSLTARELLESSPARLRAADKVLSLLRELESEPKQAALA